MTDWKEFQDTGIAAAKEAGRVLQEWSKKFTISEKSRKNLVTEADVNAQDAIFGIIHDKYPDHSFLGEEDLAVQNADSDFRWIIDPLDGTTNYVHQFPYYCVSIALEYQGELTVGVIFDPTRDELFTAIRGEGASLNGEPIRTSDADQLYDAMCVASLPVGGTGDEPQVKQFLNVFPKARSVQRTGSAALNLSYVACGRLDAYWSGTLKPWDQAAGVVIVREAGGQVTTIGGADFDVQVPDMLASNDAPVHKELIEALSLNDEPTNTDCQSSEDDTAKRLLSNSLDSLDKLYDQKLDSKDVEDLLLATGIALRNSKHYSHFTEAVVQLKRIGRPGKTKAQLNDEGLGATSNLRLYLANLADLQ